MTRTVTFIAGVGLLLALIVTSCGDDGSRAKPAAKAQPPSAFLQDREAENPDRGKWRDLSKDPFDPDRVKGTLVVGYKRSPTKLNNLLWRDSITPSYFKHYLCPFLLEETPDVGENGIVARPCAAASLPTVAADGVTYSWTLRDDLTWSDGVPLTAKDYVFTWELMQNPDIRCDVRRGSMASVDSVTATGKRTFDVKFKERHYNASSSFGLAFTVVPSHAVPTDAAAFNAMKQHVGFGPYRIVEYSNQRLLLTLRDEYRAEPFPIWPCYVESIEFKYIPDNANRLEQLRQGKIDITTIPSGQFASMGQNETFRANGGWRTAYPLPNYEFIAWNTRDPDNLDKPHPLFGSAAVRRAMSHLVDRDHIVKKVRHGLARKVNGPYWFPDADYDNTVPQIPFDPKEARSLLEKEGWEMNAKGVLEKNGAEFSFELLVIGSELWKAPAAVVARDAAKAGVKIDVVTVTAFGRMFEHQFDAFLVRNGLDPVEPDQFELFHSSLARIKGNNWVGLSNPSVDKLLESVRVTLDRGKRLKLRRTFHTMFDQVHPYTVICCTYSAVGINRRWENVKVHDLGIWFRDLQLRK